MSNTFTSLMARTADAILSVPTIPDLPVQETVGGIRYVEADDTLYTFDGASWSAVAGGGGGGAVDSVFGRTGVVVAVAGDYAITQIDGGSTNGVAGFDGSGVGKSLDGWSINTNNGLDLVSTIDPGNNGSYNNFESDYVSLNPSITDANQNWYMRFIEMSAGDDNSGNQVGDATNGSMRGLGVSLKSTQTSNVGNLVPLASYITLGNGTDPMSGNSIIMYDAVPSLNLGGVSIEGLTGYNLSFNGQAGSEVNGQVLGVSVGGQLNDVSDFFGSTQGVVLSGTTGSAVSYQSAHNYADVANTVNVYTDFNQQTGTIGQNYYSAAYNPSLDTITGSYFGLSVSPTVVSAGNADGLNIDMSNVTSGGTVRAANLVGDVSITGALSFTGGLSIGQLSAFSSLVPSDGGGNPASNNSLVTQMNATGTVANVDTIGFACPALINLDSTFQGTSSSFGLGLAAMGLPNVIYMEAGSSLDYLTACAYVNLFDATNTGGTIDTLIGARSFNVTQGGTQTINRAYNYFADYSGGDIATDSWGYYDSGAKYNWMANSLKIGATDTVTNNSVGLELDTRAVLLARLNSTARDALTAVDGMMIYNTTTNKFQGRAGGAWVDFH